MVFRHGQGHDGNSRSMPSPQSIVSVFIVKHWPYGDVYGQRLVQEVGGKQTAATGRTHGFSVAVAPKLRPGLTRHLLFLG